LKGRWSPLLLVILVLLCAGVAQTSPGHSILTGLGVTATPPSYTELSFTMPDGLQETVGAVQAPITVSFGIHNVSKSPKDYHWSAVAVHDGTNEGSVSGAVTVAAQGRTSVTGNIQATCPSGRDQVVVRLASPAESINFWVTCPAVSAPAKKKTG
jgi:hypothetical protein